MRISVVILVLHAIWGGTLSARTNEQLTEDITDRDRQINQLQNQVERLRYVAGDSVSRGSFPRTGADHDLLIHIADEVHSGFEQVASDRASELTAISLQAREIEDSREEIDKLKLAWSKAMGYAMGMSAVVSVVLHFLHGFARQRYRRREPERSLVELA